MTTRELIAALLDRKNLLERVERAEAARDKAEGARGKLISKCDGYEIRIRHLEERVAALLQDVDNCVERHNHHAAMRARGERVRVK